MMNRRQILKNMSGSVAAAMLPATGVMGALDMEKINAYGIIGQMKVAAGKRDELVAILADGTKNMPGNLSYVISNDLNDENAIWITEYWESKDAQAASLKLESVQNAIGKGRPMIEGFGHRFEVAPVAGA